VNYANRAILATQNKGHQTTVCLLNQTNQKAVMQSEHYSCLEIAAFARLMNKIKEYSLIFKNKYIY